MGARRSVLQGLLFAAGAALAAAPAAAEPPADAWSFGASAYIYFVPEERDYVQPTFLADRGRWHLEGRYNYEDLDTGSLWLGANFAGGIEFEWEVQPILGGVFGATGGIAPGLKGSLAWHGFGFYTEAEYLFDTGEPSSSYLYDWSELTYAPTERLRFGMVTQRTRAYESERELERGLLVGFSYPNVDWAGYVFNPDDDKPLLVLALAVTF